MTATRYATNRPKYQVCDSCGRNAHKVAVTYSGEAVRKSSRTGHPTVGYCPSCYAQHQERNPEWPESRGGRVVYDRRKRSASS